MKNHVLFAIGIGLLLSVVALPAFSQVSNDNEDEVYKVDQRFARDFVPGQVLVKMKDGNPANVRRVRGKYQSAGISKLDEVLTRYGAEEMEQLLPKAKVGKTPRRAKAYTGQTIVERDLTQLYRVTLSPEKTSQTLQLVEELRSLDEVEFAEPNYKVYLMETTNLTNCTNVMDAPAEEHIADSYSGNPFVSQQWYLDAYGVKELWNKPIIHPERPVIAIIDTGVDLTHPDLKDNLWTNTAEAEGEDGYDNDGNGFKGDVHGWDFINNTPNIRDNNMHGTHVAGIAAACNNGIGIVGANPRALIMPVSVMQSDGSGDVATIIKGIDYAVANGATVLNLSLGTSAASRALRLTLERAYQNVVIVAAAGNSEFEVEDVPSFPAAYSFVLGVQATKKNGQLADFTNYDVTGPTFSHISSLQDPDGFNYELKAPGVDILSTIPGGKYKVLQGTSMASPLVAGAISSLMLVKDYTKDEGLIHQEILWGDLLHSSNIADAFYVTNRPAELDLIKLQINDRKDLVDETESDYSGDQEIDAGELCYIYPVIRSTFGAAKNIKMHLEMGDEFEDASTVEFLSDIVDFGMSIDAFGRGVSLNPLVLKVANGVADNRHIKLKMVATCDESTEAYEWPLTIVVTNMVKINGLVTENTTLKADHTYLVNESLGIMKGVTLTIEPGTRLEFNEGTELRSFGKLVAKGTPDKPIIFTNRVGQGLWNGIITHISEDRHYHTGFYMNDEMTLFTLESTEQTPVPSSNTYLDFGWTYRIYVGRNEAFPKTTFYITDYIDEWESDFTARQELLTDPDYLTTAYNRAFQAMQDYYNSLPDHNKTSENSITYTDLKIEFPMWETYDNPRDTISYCKISNFSPGLSPIMYDCDVSNATEWFSSFYFEGYRNNIHDWPGGSIDSRLRFSNIVNNGGPTPKYSELYNNNFFNNPVIVNVGKYSGTEYWLEIRSNEPVVDKSVTPSYLGTGREDLVRPHIKEMGNSYYTTYGKIDLSNLRTTPISEAHGIVWKVVVNGKDAQDEYEELPPLGVGKHKFEVYFNRPMNKNVAPQIAFGVRDPYTQNPVSEEGSWNEEGTIYTAYKTITGKTKSDGVNRIYVWGAEDNEYFECPYEKTRFNIQVQAAGSLATGFAAEAKMGRVNLTWNNENNDFADAMGFNIYRYGEPYEKQVYNPHYDENWNYQEYETIIVVDTVRLNTEILDIETTSYTDYDVTPGETYHYYYKVLSTDLQEYDVSNVVAATPLTATMGDANGSGDVDVADVITTVNKITGMEPKPFIFEAADMNTDQVINVLDVIGIIQKILNPAGARDVSVESTAIYTVENGMLYVESPVALAGVQVQLALSEECRVKSVEFATAADLDGFEQVSTWLSDNDYLFMAYSMSGKTLASGKHALLHIGEARVTSMRLSDAYGQNVTAIGGETTSIDRMGRDVMNVDGIYDLQGRKLSTINSQPSTLKKGVYIINGQKVVR